jgi:hypothetical protein
MEPLAPGSVRQETMGRIYVPPNRQYRWVTYRSSASRLGMVPWCYVGVHIYLVEGAKTNSHICLSFPFSKINPSA